MAKIVWIDEDIDVIGDLVQPLQDAPDAYNLVLISGFARANDRIEDVLSADLVILDIIGPSGSDKRVEERRPGITFLRELRDRNWHKPVVALSVIAAQVAEELKQYDVTEVLTKPVRPSVLKAAVDRALLLESK